MSSVPLKHTTTYQHAFDERMRILIAKYVSQGMDGVAASNKARFEAKDYAQEVVRNIVIADKMREVSGHYASPAVTS